VRKKNRRTYGTSLSSVVFLVRELDVFQFWFQIVDTTGQSGELWILIFRDL
jgi:hypothetical protein